MKDERILLDKLRKHILKKWPGSSIYMSTLKPQKLREFLLAYKNEIFIDSL